MLNPKPCPLCSGTKLETWRTLIPRHVWRYQIVCVTCYYVGMKAITRLGAIWKWNWGEERGDDY